ncbi:MAG: hypothetical protein IT256_09365 [Chitinophagaceae bacterium]|nr:hypothetical protein [Chitinophagaceae bacterium]
MKKLLKLSFAVLVATMLSTSSAQAAFPIKQEAAKTELTVPAVNSTTSVNAANETSSATQITNNKEVSKKASSSGITQGVYILMSIFMLGWLAIGINTDWDGYDWLIALLLYCVLWLPGFIFSLIKMGDYY